MLGPLRARFLQIEPVLDERARRLFVANEALSLGDGGVTAVAVATEVARSTINRGISALKSADHATDGRIRRPGAVEGQPGLVAALEALIEDAIRGDPEAPLRWVSRSQRNIAEALCRQGFAVSQKLVGLCCGVSKDMAARPTARREKGPTIPTAMRSSSTSTPW